MFGFRQIPITCEYCFVQLSSTDDPLEHVSQCKKVSSEKEVKRKVLLDEVCGKTTNDFSSDKAFSEHNNSHMGNLYKCQQCPADWKSGPENHFDTKQKLSTHCYQYHSSKHEWTSPNIG